MDVRIVCATNRDPVEEVAAGRLREDLFYRLHVVPVNLPPLRERPGDIGQIARHLLTQYAQEETRGFRTFDAEAMALLEAYDWPGNVRELQNIVRHVVVLNDGVEATAAMLPPPIGRGGNPASIAAPGHQADAVGASRDAIRPLWEVERDTDRGRDIRLRRKRLESGGDAGDQRLNDLSQEAVLASRPLGGPRAG